MAATATPAFIILRTLPLAVPHPLTSAPNTMIRFLSSPIMDYGYFHRSAAPCFSFGSDDGTFGNAHRSSKELVKVMR